MIKACIFDLDGTIADTIETITYYANRALNKFGYGNITSDRYKFLVGNGYEILVKNMLNELDVYDDKVYNEMKEFYHDDYETDSLYKTTIYDGINELMEFLSKNGIKKGVITNKPQGAAEDVLKHFFKDGTFEYISGVSEGTTLKPDSMRLNKMLDDMGVSKDEILYFGDTKTDMETAKNGDVFAVGVLWGFRPEKELTDNGADMIIKHPKEIIDFICDKNNIKKDL
ncbi:MAG: HAD family hydrolase [Ruminococcaceae bacterium]|nr:HAD family hydrolase [Oscillospiraceae bacterium]